jgi:4-amino-4-deoxy-L-arabinose transferase-like glycosyltransferase
LKLLDELHAENSVILPVFLFLATILTRMPFTSKLMYHMDSIQFALALEKFDVTVHQPHPPGYFLYVMLGRIFNFFIQDPNNAFISISILFSALTVVVVYYLGKELFDSKCALVAALIAITSPNLWFHGEVALSYAVEAFFSTFIAFLCWKVYTGNKRQIWLLAITMALAGGIRQNTPVFLLPLCLFSVSKLSLRTILAAVCLFTATSLLWFIPMIRMTGGLDAYLGAFRKLWAATGANNTVFDLGLPALKYHVHVLLNFIACGIGLGIVIIIFSGYLVIRNRKLSSHDFGKRAFFTLWILPSFLFFLLIAIHPSIPGHVLIFLPPLLLLTARSTICISNEITRLFNFDIAGAITIILALTNLVIFFYLTGPASYRRLVRYDRNLATVINRLSAFDPSKVILLLYQNRIYYGLSHAVYYLPEFTVYDPQVMPHAPPGSKRIWGGIHRKVFLTDKIVIPKGAERFASLFLTYEVKDLPKEKNIQVEQLTQDICLVSAPISEVGKIYPDAGKIQFQ